MPIVSWVFFVLVLAFFTIAALYSSVGFGGGSSYLALLALVFTSFYTIRSTALLCNLTVVGGSCLLFYRSGYLDLKKFLPFIVTSVPFAFLGASFRLKEHFFFSILGFSLIISAVALIYQSLRQKSRASEKIYPKSLSYVLGAGIGLLSGLVGIGGGIFLAPVLNHLKWDKPIIIASLASFFILVNSISGIAGLVVGGSMEIFGPGILVLLLAVMIGGQLGTRLGIKKMSPKRIKLITALLVFFVGIRVLVKNGALLNLFS